MIMIFGALVYNYDISMCFFFCFFFCFFQFFKILIFQVVSGINSLKWQKNSVCQCFISQEPYIIWLSFIVHKCRMIISLGAIFIFSKFWIFRFLGGSKRAKNSPKWQKFLSVILHVSGTIHYVIIIYSTRV